MTDSKPLDIERFDELLDVHGADLARWPEALRRRAQDLLASSAAAEQALARAVRMAALLDAVPELLPSAELSARIAALPARRPQGWAVWWPFGNPLAPLLAWGAAAAFGLFVGSGLVPGLEPLTEGGVAANAGTEAGRAAEESSAVAVLPEEAEAAAEDGSLDEAESDEWNELELALGLGSDWEEEP
jgi:hypothetical protein